MKYLGREGCLERLTVSWFKRARQLNVTGRAGNMKFYLASDYISFHDSGHSTLGVLMWVNFPSPTVYILKFLSVFFLAMP